MCTSGKEVDDDIVMTCPSKCSVPTTIPGGAIQNLPKNFAVMEIVHTRQFERSMSRGTLMLTNIGEYNCDVCECMKAEVACPNCAVSLCLKCSNDIHQKKGYQVHRLILISDIMDGTADVPSSDGMVHQLSATEFDVPSDQPKMCKIHTSELVEYVCMTCTEEVCKKCHLVDSHRGHDCRLLKDVAQEKRDSLRPLLSSMQEKHTLWNRGFDRCQELREYANIRRNELEQTIRSSFQEIYAALNDREESILRGLREEMDSRDQLLSSQAK